jgi:periplasmic copper chaperone A
VRKLAATALVGAAALALVSGCSASGPVGAGNAYIPVPITPGTTDAYLEIRNNGPADELISAQLSVGGTVSLRAPVTNGTEVMSMHSVSDIPIPADSTVHLAPNSYHLLITGATDLQSGKAITLKLTFAHAGTLDVVALVTNPQSGGSSYFLN